MKRVYKIGDWFRIPLPGAHDAVGIITHACRSRLFGYFFPIPATHVPSFDELKSLRARDAVTCALFGGAGLEDARWKPIATSLAFDARAWPFPHFVSRGVFGRTFSRITYDPLTMGIVRRESLPQLEVLDLPDARFATPDELESFLQARIVGETPETPLVVCEVRPPLDFSQLALLLSRGGRVQFSEALEPDDLERLAAFIESHPQCELRVHGMANFDVTELRAFTHLRSLVLDVGSVQHAEALQELKKLESLRVSAMKETAALDALVRLPELHRLELRGAQADLQTARRVKHLDSLALIGTPAIDFSHLTSAHRLRSLSIAHAQWPVRDVSALPMLERLALRNLQIESLPDLSANTLLHAIELQNVTLLRDLTPLASAPALCDLRIEGMPQLQVSDFAPLTESAELRSVVVDLTSKSKSREVHRLLGKTVRHCGTNLRRFTERKRS